MKKISFFLLGLAGLSLASCSQDDIPGIDDGNGNVSVTVNLPSDIATRAYYGEGETSKQLNYAVYEVSGDNTFKKIITDYQDIGTNLTTNLKLNLLAGSKYAIVLFAESTTAATGTVYQIDYDTQTLTVNYGNMESTDNIYDAYDCFYGSVTTGILGSNGSSNYNVDLKRPMAQINWGTSDLNSNEQMNQTFAEGRYIQTTFTAENAPTSLNLLTGEVGSNQNVTLNGFLVPGAYQEDFTYQYPVAGYQYLAMEYVLASEETSLYDVNLNIKNNYNSGPNNFDKNISLTGVPLQANYRTNVYGELLSSEADVNITITPDWDGSSNITSKWDGTSTTPTTSGNYSFIEKASDLAGLAEMVSNGTEDFSGKTIVLVNDFDMSGFTFPGIGTATRSSASTGSDTKPFSGTFDGNGHTISGLNIEYTGTNKDAVAAFIPNLDGAGEVKDVTFDNVTINGGAAEQAGIVGLVTNGATVKSVTVKSGSITTGETGGAIVGRMIKSGTISDCHNLGASVTGTEKVGGIVGAAYYNDENTTMTIEKCTNEGTISGTKVVGGIVGQCAANVSGCSNSGNIISSGAEAGGIVAWQFMSGSIKGCTNTGSVNGVNIVGGIVGNISYSNVSSSYPVLETIVIDGNKNEGNITSANETGGIIGRANSSSVCSYNVNTSSALNATNGSVAGIIGVIYGTDVLITGNTSSTTLEQMEGETKNWIYNVPGKNVTPAAGSQENEQTFPAGD